MRGREPLQAAAGGTVGRGIDALRSDAMSMPIALAMTALLPAACGDDPAAAGEGWTALRDTVGDTVVVRTTGGSVWGPGAKLVEDLRIGRLEGPPEVTFGDVSRLAVADDGSIHVVDDQVPAVRVFDREGNHLRTLGGEGDGPGEYRRPNGIAVLPDGRVVVRDPGTGRLNVYAAEGDPVDTWPQRTGHFTGTPLVVDTAGHLYNRVSIRDPDPPHDVRSGFVRFGPRGEVTDTILAPRWEHERPLVTGRTPAGNRRASPVPFAPTVNYALSPFGYFIGGVSTRYAVNLYRGDAPVLQIRKDHRPVPVDPAEKAEHRRYIVDRISSMVPGWEWNGSEIPNVKPSYRGLVVGQDGRVWVLLHRPGLRRTDEPTSEPGRPVPPRWTEPVVYDVFEPDGRYLGRLRAPDGFQIEFPRPVARGDTLWGAVKDELGVDYVVRLVVETS